MILPTYNLIKVKDIKNGICILENGGLRAILRATGINFSLLSEREQEIITGQFKSFLDGLDFNIEILNLSRLENINNYLKILNLKLESENDPLIKFQLEEYIKFLEDYTENNQIIKKMFFIIVPYDVIKITTSPLGKIPFLQNLSKETEQAISEVEIEGLNARVSYVKRALSNIGITVEQLNTQEIIELLFEIYNPNLKWGQVPKPIIEKLSELT